VRRRGRSNERTHETKQPSVTVSEELVGIEVRTMRYAGGERGEVNWVLGIINAVPMLH
jgi:hypothetical protein